jgi:hypothetical protein
VPVTLLGGSAPSLLRAGLSGCCSAAACRSPTCALLPQSRHSTSSPPVPWCWATGHPALRRSCLHPPCLARRCLPPSLLDAMMPPCSVPGCCSVAAYWPPACTPYSRHSASPPPMPTCHGAVLPATLPSGLWPPPSLLGASLPPYSMPPCSTGSSARHLGLAGLLPTQRDGASRQSAPSLSLLQTLVLCAMVRGIVLLLKFDLCCLNFFSI